MRRIIAAGFAGLLIFAGAASAATPAQRIAALEKQVKALNKKVTAQQKQIKQANDRAIAALIAEFCMFAVTADAIQSTWTTIDQSMTAPLFGPQQTIADGRTCEALQITRQGIRTPPTTAVFSAVASLISSRSLALRLW